MQAIPAIESTGLSKTYRRRGGEPIRAVVDADLSVSPGQVFGFLGPNGAGKTTTIKMICGLVRPTAGRVHVNGCDVWHRRATAMRQIGAVLEGTRNVHWALSAWDNLIYFGHLKGMSGRPLAARADQLLCELELWDRRRDLVRTFSRGMQQKVAVACALIADPPIVLLDEPTLGLDVQAARAVRELVGRLARDQGKTVVLTTHQMEMAETLCDRIAIIRKGQIIADQLTGELLNLFRQEHYQVRIKGRIPMDIDPVAYGLSATEKNGDTVLSGPIASQDALYGILARLRDHRTTLLSVNRTEPNLEEVFMRLLEESGGATP
jgi:ABC-2 type transport system ATP-binding protein